MTFGNIKANAKAWLFFSPTSRPRKVLKQKLIILKNYLNNNPKLKRKLLNILEYIPSVKHRLQRIGNIEQKQVIMNIPKNENDLSLYAQEIYQQLQVQIKQHKGLIK